MSMDKLAGIYVYCADYHSGQNSRLYRLLSRIGRDLRLNDSAFGDIRNGGKWRKLSPKRWQWQDGEWSEAHNVYQSLVARKAT